MIDSALTAWPAMELRKCFAFCGPAHPDAIAASALALADREGLEAVTIRRLAQDHQVTPMALYRHFQDKDALIDGMAERLLASIRLPEADSGSWDAQMQRLLQAFVDALRAHPSIAGLVVTRILSSDPGLDLAERVLALLRAADFTPEQAAEAGTYALCSLAAWVATERGPDLEPEARDAALRLWKATLSALSPRQYPNIIDAAGTLAHGAADRAFYQLGITLVVAGMRALRPDD
jgi:TetR/AcrR family tetracycline transcriptional repressor